MLALTKSSSVIRLLWEGGSQSHHGTYFTVEDARLYTLPDAPPPIYIAAAAPLAAKTAGRLGDGLISTRPQAELISAFSEAAEGQKPRYGQLTVCWAEDEAAARRMAHECWPNAAVPGSLNAELPLPEHFEQAAQLIGEDDVAERVTCGPDPQRHIAAINQFVDAGFTHVSVHQVGPDQDGFFEFYRREVLPQFHREDAEAA